MDGLHVVLAISPAHAAAGDEENLVNEQYPDRLSAVLARLRSIETSGGLGSESMEALDKAREKLRLAYRSQDLDLIAEAIDEVACSLIRIYLSVADED